MAEPASDALLWQIRRLLGDLLIACMSAAAMGFGALALATPIPQNEQEKHTTLPSATPAVSQEKLRYDLLGDPLPRGAIARLGSVRLRPGGACCSVAFSPTEGRLVSQGYDGAIRFWDLATGKEVLCFMAGAGGWDWPVAFTPDGKHLIGMGRDSVVCRWDAATGKEVSRLDPASKETCKGSRYLRMCKCSPRSTKRWCNCGTPRVASR